MTISFNSGIELNDSEILRLEQGPVKYARDRMGKSMNIDQFVKDLEEQCNMCGFKVEVKVMETNVRDVYGFEVEINGRTLGSLFDPDLMVHEVTNNILQLPGAGTGFIPSKEGIKKLLARESHKNHKRH